MRVQSYWGEGPGKGCVDNKPNLLISTIGSLGTSVILSVLNRKCINIGRLVLIFIYYTIYTPAYKPEIPSRVEQLLNLLHTPL